MTTLILIRHGETSTNVKNILHKFVDPDNLTSEGIKQIELVGYKLKNLGLDVLYTSKEHRAKQSAKIIAKICNIKVNILEGMEERNWGDLSGISWDEIKIVLDSLDFNDRYNYVPPKGESWKTFETRLINCIKKVVQNNSNNIIGIVTHGGSIRALMPFLLNVSKEESYKYNPKNASISIFYFDEGKITPGAIDDR